MMRSMETGLDLQPHATGRPKEAWALKLSFQPKDIQNDGSVKKLVFLGLAFVS